MKGREGEGVRGLRHQTLHSDFSECSTFVPHVLFLGLFPWGGGEKGESSPLTGEWCMTACLQRGESFCAGNISTSIAGSPLT